MNKLARQTYEVKCETLMQKRKNGWDGRKEEGSK